jgi:RNA polymerase sigma-70 factor (ECF subfamily)
MDEINPHVRLNQIGTLWSVVRQAHGDAVTKSREAKQALLERYRGAIERYLLGALHDQDAADECAQEFALRFLHGDLKGADEEKGRFRDYVKGVLFRLVADFHNKKKREPGKLSDHDFDPGKDCPLAQEREEAFRMSWREDLLTRTWKALERVEKEHHQPYFTVLRFRAEHPDYSSTQMAEKLSVQLNKAVNAAGVRKTLERARERYGDLLLDEIAQAMDRPTREAIAEELVQLGLLDYCKDALDRRFPPGREGGTG